MKRFINHLDKKLGVFYVPVALLLLTFVLLLIGYPFVKPVDTKVSLNTIATQTLRAIRTVEDTDATQKAREIAAQNVVNVYEKDDTVLSRKMSEIEQFFSLITNYRKEVSQITDTTISIAQKRLEIISNFFSSLNGENSAIKDYAIVFSDSVLQRLLLATENEFSSIVKVTKTVVEDVLGEEVYSNTTDIQKIKDKAYQSIVSSTYSDTIRETVRELVNAAIVSNMVINEEATNIAKIQASNQVSAVMITQGEIVVREGEVIGNTVYKKLQLLGMTGSELSYNLIGGYTLMLVLQFALVYYFIIQSTASLTKRALYVNMYTFIVIVLAVSFVVVTQMQLAGLEYIALVIPIGMIPYFMTNKSKRRLSILAVAFTNLVYFFIANSGNTAQLGLVWKFYAIIGLISTVVVSNKKVKSSVENFLLLSIVYLLLVTSLAALNNIALLSHTFMTMLLYSFINVLLTLGIIKIGKPYFDLLFEDKAVLKLVELSNPNHPLLKELISKAPGTYHHSIMVANLSANAVELIGGDSLFTRVACYYHDVGKLDNPMFFVENLPSGMANPHDLLSPSESAKIIISHVRNGVMKLKEHGIPKSIIDVCLEHHGTTLVKYFYIQATNSGEDVNVLNFKYPGPTPRTKESMVISIADTVEAATRAMKTPTPEHIRSLVEKTIQSRIEEGQCDNCPITMKELAIVKESLISGLSGSYHTRVEYPQMKTNQSISRRRS